MGYGIGNLSRSTSALTKIQAILLIVIVITSAGGYYVYQSYMKGSSEKVLRVGIGIDPDTLDPAGQTTTLISNIVRMVVEPLFIIDVNGKLKPWLAEGYEVSSDGLTYTIRIKKSIKFHDGTPLTAEAVKFSLERILDLNVRVPGRHNYLVIKEIEVVDDYTVRIRLKHTFAPFISLLTDTATGIMSPNAVKKLGEDIVHNLKGVGTGPFKFVEWVKGDRIVLERNDEYWGGKPKLKKIIFKVVPDANTREAMLLAGDLDMIVLPPAADIPALAKRSDVKLWFSNASRTMFIGINTQYGPLKDVRVRQALNYAVDKEAIVKNVLLGLGKPLDAPIPWFFFSYKPLKPYEYDPEKAKKLLAEAGYPDGFEVTLFAPNGRYLFDKEVAEAVASYLEAVGIKVNIRIHDWPTYVSLLFQPREKTQLQLFLLGFGVGTPDPHFQYYLSFHSKAFPPNGFNFFFYNNSEVDTLLDEAVKTLGPEKRATMYQRVSEILWHDCPWIWLYVQSYVVATSSKVKGLIMYPYEMFDLREADIE